MKRFSYIVQSPDSNSGLLTARPLWWLGVYAAGLTWALTTSIAAYACSSTDYSYLSITTPTYSNTGCNSGYTNGSTTWGAIWLINSNDPMTDAQAGWDIRFIQSADGMTNWTTVYDTMWNVISNITCNQSTYSLMNQNFTTPNCNLVCKTRSGPGGTNYYYEAVLYVGWGQYRGGVWTGGTDSITSYASQTSCS